MVMAQHPGGQALQRLVRALAPAGLALVLASSGAAAVDLQRGVVKYQAGDYEGALAEWRPLAEKNDPNALFNIGQAYRLGRGVKEDWAIALQFYERAGALGHVAAQGNAGTLLFYGAAPLQNKTSAIEWWQRAAANGDARSEYMLGVLHFNGEGVAKDWPRAYALTTRARDAGLPEASKSLDQMEKYLSDSDKTAGKQLAEQLRSASASGQPAVKQSDSSAAASQVRPDVAVPTRAAAEPAAKASVAKVPPPAADAMVKPVKAAPVPKKPAMAATPVTGAGWRVQLGSFGTEAAAQKAWSDISGANTALAGVSPGYTPTGTGGTRLQAGNYSERAGADALCAKLKAVNTPCFVVKVQ